MPVQVQKHLFLITCSRPGALMPSGKIVFEALRHSMRLATNGVASL